MCFESDTCVDIQYTEGVRVFTDRVLTERVFTGGIFTVRVFLKFSKVVHCSRGCFLYCCIPSKISSGVSFSRNNFLACLKSQ